MKSPSRSSDDNPPRWAGEVCEECGQRPAAGEWYGLLLCRQCLDQEREDYHTAPGEDR